MVDIGILTLTKENSTFIMFNFEFLKGSIKHYFYRGYIRPILNESHKTTSRLFKLLQQLIQQKIQNCWKKIPKSTIIGFVDGWGWGGGGALTYKGDGVCLPTHQRTNSDNFVAKSRPVVDSIDLGVGVQGSKKKKVDLLDPKSGLFETHPL